MRMLVTEDKDTGEIVSVMEMQGDVLTINIVGWRNALRVLFGTFRFHVRF